jgi:hypothetical protein
MNTDPWWFLVASNAAVAPLSLDPAGMASLADRERMALAAITAEGCLLGLILFMSNAQNLQ